MLYVLRNDEDLFSVQELNIFKTGRQNKFCLRMGTSRRGRA
jgi:hypothetical protein